MRAEFEARIWQHDGDAAWHFLSVPEDLADDIEARFGTRSGGFGSVRVEVTIGSSRWCTSLFPDAKRATYVLPVKKEVRSKEHLAAGSVVSVAIEVLL